MARPAGRTVNQTERTPVGIPGDRYRVEVRGASLWVIDAATGMVMGGPWRLRDGGAREKAQERADMLNMVHGRRHA